MKKVIVIFLLIALSLLLGYKSTNSEKLDNNTSLMLYLFDNENHEELSSSKYFKVIKTENKDVLNTFKINIFPTVVICGSNGQIFDKIENINNEDLNYLIDKVNLLNNSKGSVFVE